MNYIKPRVLIFSVYQAGESQDINEYNHAELLKRLKGSEVEYKELVGSYKGVLENSILVMYTPFNERLVQMLCNQFNQECYLDSGHDRHTELVYPTKRESIGYLKQVSQSIAESLDAYTYDFSNDSYWICE